MKRPKLYFNSNGIIIVIMASRCCVVSYNRGCRSIAEHVYVVGIFYTLMHARCPPMEISAINTSEYTCVYVCVFMCVKTYMCTKGGPVVGGHVAGSGWLPPTDGTQEAGEVTAKGIALVNMECKSGDVHSNFAGKGTGNYDGKQ
jgi:hypothetical protein